MQVIALAISPAIALVWFLYARSAYRPERKSLVAVLFVLGGISAGIALLLNHLVEKYTSLWPRAPGLQERLVFWIAGVGLNEEFAKMTVLLAVLYPRRDFRQPAQGLLAGATVAMGFAAVENLVYLERYGTATLIFRSLLTIPAHACFTVPMGVLLAYAKRAEAVWAKYLLLVAALAGAALLHGSYDAWLAFPSGWLNAVAYVQVGLMVVMVFRLMRLDLPEPAGVPRQGIP